MFYDIERVSRIINQNEEEFKIIKEITHEICEDLYNEAVFKRMHYKEDVYGNINIQNFSKPESGFYWEVIEEFQDGEIISIKINRLILNNKVLI